MDNQLSGWWQLFCRLEHKNYGGKVFFFHIEPSSTGQNEGEPFDEGDKHTCPFRQNFFSFRTKSRFMGDFVF